MQINFIHILTGLLLLFLCLFFQSKGEEPTRTASEGNTKTVLILNSYHPETKWSEEIATYITTELTKQFPGIHIYNGNLNIEEASTEGTLLLSLRAIIWQMAEEEGDTINPESLARNSFYQIKKKPDVIVCIGEESYYQHLSLHLWQGKWSDIPIVCCAMNDSIVSPSWYTHNTLDITHLQKIQDRKNQQNISVFRDTASLQNLQKKIRDVGLNLNDRSAKTPEGEVIITTQYHTTGVISEIPVRENLELLKKLMPDLQEIVWVDNYYYKNAYALYKLRQELPKIFPEVKLTVILNNRLNTDSIYDVMLKPVPHRAFITYALNISGAYSKHPEKQLDSLFTHTLTSPILILTERPINKNYWLGGVHNTTSSIASPAINQIAAILNGTPVDSIPYVKVSEPVIHLNVPALKRFGLENRARKIEGIIYKNIPFSFYHRHEKTILITIILSVFFIGIIIVIIKHLLFTKKIKAEYINYRKLYKKLQAIYQNSNLDFAIYTHNGTLIYRIIDGKENTSHHHPEEILSENLMSNPYLNTNTLEMLRQHQVISQEIETGYHKKHSKTKEKKNWNLILKPLHYNGQADCYMAIAIDLTLLMRERKAKERSEHIFRFASETAGIGVASYNLLNKKGFASPAWFHNLNEEKSINTLPTYQQVSEEDRKALLAFQERIFREHVATPFIRTIQVKDHQDALHYIQEYIFVQEFNPAQGTIGVVELNINYDEPKRKENELREAREKAEASNLETEQFLANISHEIRTPLNAIVGFSSIVAGSTDEEEMITLAPIIEQNNNLLLALINNILYLSKLDSGTLTFNYLPTDTHSLFNTIIQSAREQIGQKDIRIRTDMPAKTENIYLAGAQFKVVMDNLVSNAIKFTQKGEIVIGYQKRKKEYYFFIKDTGCGIHIVDQENIFKRFNKLDVFTQGTGLGLALCRSIVAHQQGQIGVVSHPGQGSTFWFTLPEITHL